MEANTSRAVELLTLIRRLFPAARTEALFVEEDGAARVEVWLDRAHCQVSFRNDRIAAMDVGRAWDEKYCVGAPVDLDLPTVSAAAEFVGRAFDRI